MSSKLCLTNWQLSCSLCKLWSPRSVFCLSLLAVGVSPFPNASLQLITPPGTNIKVRTTSHWRAAENRRRRPSAPSIHDSLFRIDSSGLKRVRFCSSWDYLIVDVLQFGRSVQGSIQPVIFHPNLLILETSTK
jgi:hypothetical protein